MNLRVCVSVSHKDFNWEVFNLKVNFGKRDILILLNLPFPGYGVSYQFFLSFLGLYVNNDNYFFYRDLKTYFFCKTNVILVLLLLRMYDALTHIYFLNLCIDFVCLFICVSSIFIQTLGSSS